MTIPAWPLIGQKIVSLGQVTSTNDIAYQEILNLAEEGTVVLAKSQTNGRGRSGNTWHSPDTQNLYMSVILRPPLPTAQLYGISFLACIAVHETVQELYQICPLIKWPNDLYFIGPSQAPRKFGGILIEVKGDGMPPAVILGIGLNLNMELPDIPPDLKETTTSLKIETGKLIDFFPFFYHLLIKIGYNYQLWVKQGFAPIRNRWLKKTGTLGKKFRYRDGTQVFWGTGIGLKQDGGFVLSTPQGRKILYSEIMDFEEFYGNH